MPTAHHLWDVDWLNLNEQRAYPFVDSATKADTSGTVELPNDFLVDVLWTVPVHVGPDASLYHLHSIAVFATGVVVNFGYGAPGARVIAATATINTGSHTTYKSYNLAGVGDFESSSGSIIVGRLDTLLSSMSGAFEFYTEATRLASRTVMPTLRGLVDIVVQDAAGNEKARLTGSVALKEGRNISLTASEELVGGETVQTVRIDCTGNSDFLAECVCEGGLAELPGVKTFSGVGPDGDGNINVIGGDCLSVNIVAGGIELEDSCSQPCCGCTELEIVTTDLATLTQQLISMEGLIFKLEAAQKKFEDVVLVSRTTRTCP